MKFDYMTKQYRVYDIRWGLMAESVKTFSDNPKNALYSLGYDNVKRNTHGGGDLCVENIATGKRYFYNAEFIARKELA